MGNNSITFEGVNFNIDFITKDMAKDFRYAHIWHNRPERNKLFSQLYSLTHEDNNEHANGAKSDGYTTSASERDV